ncbi:MAG: hypothetical protein U0798_16400 [Gemmataceae bacterium]
MAESNQLSNEISHPLEQLRGGIRKFVLWDGLLAAGLVVVIGYWLGVAFDYGSFKLFTIDWVLDAPKLLRVVGLLIFLGLLAAIVGYLWYYRLTRTFSNSSLALVLEKRFPQLLGDRLITAVELADVEKAKNSGISGDMLRDTIADARERVAKVPVSQAFNWGRLKSRGMTLVAVAIGLFILVFAGSAALSGTASPTLFGWRFANVSSTWIGRNLFLKNTPWPRRSHLEVMGFPESGELRIGKDAPTPTLRVKSYQWVIADPNTRYGWRPMLGRDVPPALSGEPAIPADRLLDEVEAEARATYATTFDRLEAEASTPAPHLIRKLVIPEAVTLRYAGRTVRGTIQLNRQANNEFVGEIAGLKESVQFYVKGEDFATDTKTITLVPPPMLLKLSRDEWVPAYLYHSAPGGNFQLLKGLRQSFAGKDFSLTGEKSTCVVLSGTELTVTGTADKPLKEIRITAKAGNVPGTSVGAKSPMVLTPQNNDSFSIAFKGDAKLTATTEFDVTLVDPDGVANTRTVTIQVVDDQPPVVELGVDILRKKGNEYLVTPIARVPFVTESFIRDDHALSKVEFTFAYSQVDAKEVVALQARAVLNLVAGTPVLPSPAAAFGPAGTIIVANQLTRTNRKTAGSAPMPRFAEMMQALPAITPELLKQRLTQPVDPDRADVIKEVKFLDPIRDGFDLERFLPKLRVTDPTQDQPQYRIELNVLATDANVESGPKTGQALEPIRLLVVSEAELLAEISKEEEGLINKLDDTIKKLKAAQAKLNDMADRLTSPAPQDDLVVSSSVRSNDITQDISKAKDQSAGILIEYKRLFREAETNRCGRNVLDRYLTSVLGPLDEVNQKQFPAAEEQHRIVNDELAANRKPVLLTLNSDKAALAELIVKLEIIRTTLGDALSIQKAQEELRKIIDRQTGIQKSAKIIRELIVEKLFAPEIKSAQTVIVNKNSTITVKHSIDWKLYDKGEIKVNIVAPDGSGLTVPGVVTVKDDKDELVYDVKSGDKTGDFKVILTPAVGKPAEVIVTVK